MGTRAIAPAAFLLATLAGCGGGAGSQAAAPVDAAEPGGPPAASPAAATDSAVAATPAAQQPGALVGPVDTSLVPQAGAPLVREVYSYAGGNRDPFVSVLEEGLSGPELADLTLVAIYYDTRNPSASVVVLRDRVTGKRHTARPGDRLGPRLRVTDIRVKDVTFLIDDFGTARQQTLTLRKQEVDTP